jgi:hypothetical protein
MYILYGNSTFIGPDVITDVYKSIEESVWTGEKIVNFHMVVRGSTPTSDENEDRDKLIRALKKSQPPVHMESGTDEYSKPVHVAVLHNDEKTDEQVYDYIDQHKNSGQLIVLYPLEMMHPAIKGAIVMQYTRSESGYRIHKPRGEPSTYGVQYGSFTVTGNVTKDIYENVIKKLVKNVNDSRVRTTTPVRSESRSRSISIHFTEPPTAQSSYNSIAVRHIVALVNNKHINEMSPMIHVVVLGKHTGTRSIGYRNAVLAIVHSRTGSADFQYGKIRDSKQYVLWYYNSNTTQTLMEINSGLANTLVADFPALAT